MNLNCICPEVDCRPVLTCINDNLLQTGEDFLLTNICSKVISCVDTEFKNVSNGQSNSFNFYAQSILKILSSLPGYTDAGDTYLSSSNGVFNWISSGSLSHTYLDNGIGITVSGDGSLLNKYQPNLSTSYVQGLFSASNGLNYSTGITKLGGTLTQNTSILGGGFSFGLSNTSSTTLSSAALDLKASLSVSNYGELSLLTTQSFFQLMNGVRSYALILSDISQMLTLGTTQDITIQDGTSYNPAVLGTNKTYLRVANYHHRTANDRLVLVDALTGEIGWATPENSLPSYSNEDAQDAVGSILLETTTIKPTYNDITPSISYDVKDSSITFDKIQNINTGKLLGRSSALIGDVEEISITGGIELTGAGAIRVGAFTGDVTKLAGGTALTIGSDTIDDSKLRNSTGFSVIGRSVTGLGDPSDIVAASDQVLRRVGSGNLEFGSIVTSNVANDQITFSKIQNINSNRLLGRVSVGSGDIEELVIGNGLLLAGGILQTFGRTIINITKFSSSGTWTKPVGCNAVIVYVIGGGAGGGGVTGAGASTSAGAGGGSGGFSINYINVGLGSSEAIVVGSGGAGGLASGATGSNGTSSSFGSFVSVGGGTGGQGMLAGSSIALSTPGALGNLLATSGTNLGSGGSFGQSGIRLSGTIAISGASGSSLYNGSAGSVTNGIGLSANALGGGGSGAASNDGNNYFGGSGLSGLVIVYELS